MRHREQPAKFRNSRFETGGELNVQNDYRGVSRADGNTLGGKTAENRGRRGSQQWIDSPFENGPVGGSFSGRGPRGYNRPDARIFDEVCEVLTQAREVDASGVEVKVESGVVTLTGKVEDRIMKRFAGRIIHDISGIKDIHNLLEFDRS